MAKKLRGYKDLLVWQKSMKLAVDTYKDVSGFPKEELFGLTSQIKRSVVSIPSNIAEGWARDTNNYFTQSISIAKGSLAEFETQIELAYLLEFISEERFKQLTDSGEELGKMLNGLIKSVKKKQA